MAAASAFLVLAIWCSSGTMAPYAATAEYPTITEPCHYLVNVDHPQFVAVFHMLRGDGPESWIGSVVLRRLLFPVIALPFVETLGVLVGGLIASAAIHVVALLAFTSFVRREAGETAAVTVAWLLATYPGITYWAGLPYSYATIVPGSLACLMLLYWLERAENLRDIARAAALLGVVFLAYDFLPIFGLAAGLLLLARRRVTGALVAAVVMIVPTLLVVVLFISIGIPLVNSNTASYLVILHAYLHPGAAGAWMPEILRLPSVFISNFLFSNMIVLPVLFCFALAVAYRFKINALARPDLAVLAGCLFVFLVNNAAPPYFGWQLRGHWIARLYQPVFVAFLMAIARTARAAAQRVWWRGAVAFSVVVNASIAFGPLLMNPLAAVAYQRFYVHSPPESLLVNMRRYGRRPLGVCRSTHEWDAIPNPNTPLNRPSFMYRYPAR